MTTELLLSATLGLTSITLGLYFVWSAFRERKRQALLQAQYDLYAVRDRIVRLAAEGKLDPESDLFAGLFDLVNMVIGLGGHAGFHFHHSMIAAANEQAHEDIAQMMSEAVGPDMREDEVAQLVTDVGNATFSVICANSRIVRVMTAIETFNSEPDIPAQPQVGSLSLALWSHPNSVTTARLAH